MVKLFFKVVSVTERGDSCSGYSGIGVVLERSRHFELIQVQKKLDFYAEESVTNYLALIDGVKITSEEKKLEIPILVALRERVLEKTSKLDGFVLKLAPLCDLGQALCLAQVAVGICNLDVVDKLAENCSICCDDRLSEMMLTLKCTHKFCSHCMKTYVQGKVQSSEVPIRSFEEASMRGTNSGNIYCPYPNFSFLLDPRECLSPVRASASSCSQLENSSCVKCPLCERFVCVDCGVPWHDSMSCEEFQILPVDERYPDESHCIAWLRIRGGDGCQQCRVMMELAQGCNHMTCRFQYSMGLTPFISFKARTVLRHRDAAQAVAIKLLQLRPCKKPLLPRAYFNASSAKEDDPLPVVEQF
ncbi:hypothetical protein Bca52824_017522 [Brassica carinata]|uniref:RBR-type E3 ubiquitin transferase n=1 Tax=Brassica carinata TaxID=52824 RepID=A0A8X7VP89_BRACI|nr:hypothetical protein Bca52824_017522 [Brassica carinata]